MDIFNGIKEQLSSCPEHTRALCRTVWGTLSLSLSTALQAASIEDAGGGGSGGLVDPGGGGVGAGGCGSGSGRFATIMGAVKSRPITSADVDADEQLQHPHHHNHHSMRNGHQHNGSTSGGGTLQKQDLRYDIGCSSQYQHVRQPSLRSRSQQPMPTTDELDRRFAKVLVSKNKNTLHNTKKKKK